jgi:ketosteroid isomerase-like protein
MSRTETIQAIYEAFGRGDVPAILSHLASDVDWNNSGVASSECPWNGNFSGQGMVGEFFKVVAEQLDFKKFEPQHFIASGEHVVALLHLESIVKRTGKPLVNDVVHVWRFNADGKVASYRHYNDTAMELAAWRG